MKIACILLAVLELSLTGCGHDGGNSLSLIQGPPIKELTSDKLRALAVNCENYPAGESARGPYDAAYCRSAIESWNNVPLQAAGISRPVLMSEPGK
jgi:hypothetical protein